LWIFPADPAIFNIVMLFSALLGTVIHKFIIIFNKYYVHLFG
jgi:hypothetical protein